VWKGISILKMRTVKVCKKQGESFKYVRRIVWEYIVSRRPLKFRGFFVVVEGRAQQEGQPMLMCRPLVRTLSVSGIHVGSSQELSGQRNEALTAFLRQRIK